MNTDAPNLAPYKGLRADILVAVKRTQPLATRDLAELLGVSTNAIRHHLKELEAEGIIRYEREQRGVGAPTFVYRLTERGESLFPKRYEAVISRLLSHIIESEGREAAIRVVEQEYEELARRLQPSLRDQPDAERVRVVSQALRESGYMTEFGERDGQFHITEHNCAIRAVAECLPEVCEAEARFLRQVLPASVERREHMLAGCNTCTYTVSFNASHDRPSGDDGPSVSREHR